MAKRPHELLIVRDHPEDPRRFLVVRDGDVLGGGGGGGGGGVVAPADPVLMPAGINANPGDVEDVFVRWQFAAVQLAEGTARILNVQLSRTSPVPLFCNAVVTGGTAGAADFELVDSRGNVSTTTASMFFPPGSSSDAMLFRAKTDAVGAEGTETVIVALQTTGDLAFPIDGSAPYRVSTSPTFGNATMTANILDGTPPATPTWAWVGGPTIVVPETIGTFDIEIALDGPADDDIQILVQSANGAPPAIAGTHYVAVNTVVAIAQGESFGSVSLQIIDDPGAVVGPNLEVNLTGAVIAGTCNDPVADVLSVEIVDDDLGSAPRTVQWTATNIGPLNRPLVAGDEVDLALTATVSVPFAAETDVPFTVTNLFLALGLDYVLVFPPGVAFGILRFRPQSSVSQVHIRVLAGASSTAPQGTVTLTIQDGATYDVGTNDALVVTVQAAGVTTEDTRLLVRRGIRNGRTLVEGMAAVVPPSLTLPRFNIAGEDCQVIGHTRDAFGRYDSCWVVGIAAGDIAASDAAASFPDQASPLVLTPGAGGTPAESGNFDAQDFSAMKFLVRPANTGVTFERDLGSNLAGLLAESEPPQWEGPSGALFPQVGADLRRTFYFRLWPKDPASAVADDANPPADERCGLIEFWMQYRADIDAITCYGLWKNCAVDKTASQTSTNPQSDGPINLLSLKLDNIPAGWSVTWGAQSAVDSFAGATLTLLPARASNYYFSPGAVMPFAFVLHKTATTSAAEAQRAARWNSTFLAVGEHGPTRQNIVGEAGDLTIDHGRAGFPALGGGWAGVAAAGLVRSTAYMSAWAGGTQSFPVFSSPRHGWMHTTNPGPSGDAGGTGIHGTCLVGASSWSGSATEISLMADISRTRLDAQDVLSGDSDWQNVRVEEFGSPQEFAPWVADGFDRKGMFRHPWLNTTQAANEHIYFAPTGQWCLAPTSLPWNTHEGAADADLGKVDHMLPSFNSSGSIEQYAMTHSSRAMTPCRDGWWFLRHPLAYRQVMQYCAWASRVFSVYDVNPATNFGGDARFPLKRSNFGHMRNNLDVSAPNFGVWRFTNGDVTAPGGICRSYAWGAVWFAIATAIGSDRVRAFTKPVTGLKHWFREFAFLISHATTPWGTFGTISEDPDPDAYQTGIWGACNAQTRQGVLPHTNPPPQDPTSGLFAGEQWSYGLLFHTQFLVLGTFGCMYRGLRNFPSDESLLLKQLRINQFQRAAALAFGVTDEGDAAFPLFPVSTRGANPPKSGTAPSTWQTQRTLSQMLAGDMYWDFPDANGAQINKVGVSVYAYRQSGDQADLNTYQVARQVGGLTLAQAFAAAYGTNPNNGSFVFGMAGNADNQKLAYGEHSFFGAWLAEVLNILT